MRKVLTPAEQEKLANELRGIKDPDSPHPVRILHTELEESKAVIGSKGADPAIDEKSADSIKDLKDADPAYTEEQLKNMAIPNPKGADPIEEQIPKNQTPVASGNVDSALVHLKKAEAEANKMKS